MNVLVMGANGFIGRHVTKALREAGRTPITLDCVGDVDIHADITQPLPKIEGLDAVIHLAAVSHPRDCDTNPSRAFDVNVNGTHQVLKMALASGAKKFVFSSSAHVYDIPPRYMPTDEMHPLRLNNTYTTTKILGEHLCQLYFENHGLSYTTLRLFNAYGTGQALGYFIPDMIGKAQEGHIGLTGGDTTKDWVYVEDVADAFVRALTTPFVGAINIGTGVETNLETIARFIADVYKAELTCNPIEHPTRMCADIGRAQRVLGWTPKVTIGEGLDTILNLVKA